VSTLHIYSRRWPTLLVAVASLALGAAQADASILLPEAPAVDVAALLAPVDDSAGAGAGTRNTDRSPSEKDAPNDAERLAQHLLPTEGPSSSSSTSSSSPSSGGHNSAGAASLHSVAATSTDLGLHGWLHGEQRFTLPTPPGTDLLRPPQV